MSLNVEDIKKITVVGGGGSMGHATGLKDVDLVFESILEEKEVKKKCMQEIEKYAPEHCIIASGTSAIMISEMAGAMKKKEKNRSTGANEEVRLQAARRTTAPDRLRRLGKVGLPAMMR